MLIERVKTFEGPEAGAGSGGGGAPSPGFAAAVDAGLGGGGAAAPSANTPAAPAAPSSSEPAGGGGIPMTPGGASVVSDIDLPENLREQFGGAARLSEYHSGVQAQFRQMQEQVETLREYAAMLQERAAQTGNPADQAAANKAAQQAGAVQQKAGEQGWRGGWKSKEEFFTDYRVRGVDAVADLAERIAEEKTRAAIEAFKAEHFAPALQPLQQQAQTQELQRYEQQVQAFNQQQIEMRGAIEQSDKRFAKGGELAPAFQKFLQDNNQQMLQAAQLGMDPYQIARNHVLANVAAAVAPQAEEKMALVNALAGTARPGGGAPGIPQTGKRATAMESALALNARRVAEGKPPLSAAELEQKAAWIGQLGSAS